MNLPREIREDRLHACQSYADWIGAAYPLAPPPHLRDRVLSAALTARPAWHPTIDGLLNAYTRQAHAMHVLLRQTPDHGSVGELISHLMENDRVVLDAFGPTSLPELDATARWQQQSRLLRQRIREADVATLERLVPLAGAMHVRRPLWEALVQRTFETWTHADDIRRASRLTPRSPNGPDIRMIVEFGLRLLPSAVAGLGRGRPAAAVRLRLTGLGGGIWTVPMAPRGSTDPATEIATIEAGATAFCRLMAGRFTPEALQCTTTGDGDAIADFLYGASTLGCD